MVKFKRLVFYILTVIIFATLVWWILTLGKELEFSDLSTPFAHRDVSSADVFLSSRFHPLAILILQIIAIMTAARFFSYLFGKIGQPLVVGEIIAGIALGPSLMGLFLPEVSAGLFPEGSLGNLQFLSHIGLIFFMFIIGMELDIKVLKNKADAAVVVSHASIIFPYFLGVALAYFLYKDFAPRGVPFLGFGLFMGIAMSITAFPVLARIIQERGLTKTPLGMMAITCAAADDVTAWCILAAVIAIVKTGSIGGTIFIIASAVVFVVFMFRVIQPLMKKIGAVYDSKEIFNKKIIGIVFIVLLGSSYVSEVIGIHALFGAFLAGVIMPQNFSFKKIIADKIEDVSLVLLLPLFFVFTGLRTQIGLLNSPELWLACLLVVFIAILGKFGGSAIAARIVGQSWKDSLSLGVLMNTRGLMELIVLNIGYDLGILSSEIFTILVLMALVTTFLTGPSLDLIEKLFRKRDYGTEALAHVKTSFNVLISFGPPRMGSTLLRLADQLTMRHNSNVEVTALHITPSSELKPYDALLFEKEGFQPVRSAAQLLGIRLNTVYRNTDEVDKEIFLTAERGKFDLVLVGAARPVFNDNATGGKLKQLLDNGQTNIGVLIDRNFVLAESILVLLASPDDLPLLDYAARFRSSNRARVVILKLGDGQSVDLQDHRSPYFSLTSSFSEVVEQRIPDKQLLGHFNLVLVSLDFWNGLTFSKNPWIKDCPSVLVIKHFQALFSDKEQDVVVRYGAKID